MNRTDLAHWLKLTNVKGLGPYRISRLIKSFRSMQNICNASDLTILQTKLMNINMITDWNRLKALSDDGFLSVIDKCQIDGVRIITYIDEDYPIKLKYLPQPPLTLFCKGDIGLLKSNIFAVVGSREVNENSMNWIKNQTETLIKRGYTIISGGAVGTDSIAHNTTLSVGGKTVVVLGSGVMNPYPPENIAMFNKIIERGGLVLSEHLPYFSGNAYALLQRNRITSGLAGGILVCRTSDNKGTFVQTQIAHNQGIPIFCPSRELNLQPRLGLSELIEKYGAREVNSAEDININVKNNVQKELA